MLSVVDLVYLKSCSLDENIWLFVSKILTKSAPSSIFMIFLTYFMFGHMFGHCRYLKNYCLMQTTV